MSSAPSFSDLVLVFASTAGLLLVCWLMGRLLVPGEALRGSKMLRLAAEMSSGLLFTTGVAALACLRHMQVTSWLALAQLLAMVIWRWRAHRAGATQPPCPERDGWSWKEAASVVTVGTVFAVFATLANVWWMSDGAIRAQHHDMGFYVSQVVALSESQAANPWSIFMGEHTVEATGIQDTWYHWGAMLLATGVRAVTGLAAAPALLLVTCGALNFILAVVGGALADALWRLRPGTATLAGAGAIMSVHFIRLVPSVLGMLGVALPFDVFHYLPLTFALTLPYKYEGVLLLLTLALWQARHPRLALAALYVAACSAPHSVAVAGAAAATLAGVGVLLRDWAMLRTGLSATGAALAGWGTMKYLFGAGLGEAQGAPAMGLAPLTELPQILGHATLDILVTSVVAGFFVAGAVFLVRRGRAGTRRSEAGAPAQEGEEARLLGWLCLCGLAGCSLALHTLRCGDRFHVVMLTHAALLMPVGALGLLGMARLLTGRRRLAAVAALACVVALGAHTQLFPLLTSDREAWNARDLAGLRAELQGRPFGYISNLDRMWWISKHATLGGLIDSRGMRLNPQDERASAHYSPYASTLPLRWLPPLKDELTTEWSLRLAHRLGVRHLLETWQDRLPRSLREKCRPIWSGSGLMLYELPPAPPETAAAGEVAAR